jgi:hypothetical protein
MQPNITVGLLDEEIQAFHKTHRWDLVPKQPNKNVMGFKWVFSSNINLMAGLF